VLFVTESNQQVGVWVDNHHTAECNSMCDILILIRRLEATPSTAEMVVATGAKFGCWWTG